MSADEQRGELDPIPIRWEPRLNSLGLRSRIRIRAAVWLRLHWRTLLQIVTSAVVVGVLVVLAGQIDLQTEPSTNETVEDGTQASSPVPTSIPVRLETSWRANTPGGVVGVMNSSSVLYRAHQTLGLLSSPGHVTWELNELPYSSGDWRVAGFDESTVVVSTRDALIAIDASTGEEGWRRENNHSVAAALDGIVLQNKLGAAPTVAFDMANGRPLWSLPAVAVDLEAPLAHDAARIYAVYDDIVYGIDRSTGALLWSADIDGYVNSIHVDGPRILIYSYLGHGVTALDAASGRVAWTFAVPEDESGNKETHRLLVPEVGHIFLQAYSPAAIFELDRATGVLARQLPGADIQVGASVAYLNHNADNRVSIVDSTSGKETGRFACGDAYSVREDLVASDRVVVCTTGIFDATTGERLRTIDIGYEGIVFSDDGLTAFIVGRDTIEAVDLSQVR